MPLHDNKMQKEFAKENFNKLGEQGDELMNLLRVADSNFNTHIKNIKNELDNEFGIGKYTDEDVSRKYSENISNIKTLLIVICFILKNAISHAFAGGETDILKKIILFLNKYPVGDCVLPDKKIGRYFNTKDLYVDNYNFVESVCLAAVQSNDIELLKLTEYFAKNNTGKLNIFSDYHEINSNDYGRMDVSDFRDISNYENLVMTSALEGGKEIFEHFKKTQPDLFHGSNAFNKFFNREDKNVHSNRYKPLTDDEIKNLIRFDKLFVRLVLGFKNITPQKIRDWLFF